MQNELIWIHEKALNSTLIPKDKETQMVFIWDDAYFQSRAYSLKRLVFIYETLCEMQIDILKGETLEVIKNLAPSHIKTIETTDSVLKKLIEEVSLHYPVEVISAYPFVALSPSLKFKRFFPYWNKAKKLALLPNGTKHG